MQEKLIEEIADILEADAETLTLDTEFKTDEYGWDSLKGYAILVMLEEEFGIEMPVESFIEAKTIEGLYRFIQEHQ